MDDNVHDLDAQSWQAIKQAVAESTWIPPEYTCDDWVNDVCRFLRKHPLDIDGTGRAGVVVPAIPTQAMCFAGQEKAREWPKFPLRISPIYQAMLAAAPTNES